MTGEGKLSGGLRAGRRRGACRGRGSLRRVPASPTGRLWHESRRRPGVRPPPVTPAGTRVEMFTPRPALCLGPSSGQARPLSDPAPLSGPLPLPGPALGPRLSSGHVPYWAPPPCLGPLRGFCPVPKGISTRLPAPLPTLTGPNPSPGAPAFLPTPTQHLHTVDVHLQLQLFHRLPGLRYLGHVVGHGCGGDRVKSRRESGRRGRLGQSWVPR